MHFRLLVISSKSFNADFMDNACSLHKSHGWGALSFLQSINDSCRKARSSRKDDTQSCSDHEQVKVGNLNLHSSVPVWLSIAKACQHAEESTFNASEGIKMNPPHTVWGKYINSKYSWRVYSVAGAAGFSLIHSLHCSFPAQRFLLVTACLVSTLLIHFWYLVVVLYCQ